MLPCQRALDLFVRWALSMLRLHCSADGQSQLRGATQCGPSVTTYTSAQSGVSRPASQLLRLAAQKGSTSFRRDFLSPSHAAGRSSLSDPARSSALRLRGQVPGLAEAAPVEPIRRLSTVCPAGLLDRIKTRSATHWLGQDFFEQSSTATVPQCACSAGLCPARHDGFAAEVARPGSERVCLRQTRREYRPDPSDGQHPPTTVAVRHTAASEHSCYRSTETT
jgi:hypothetical protein